MAKPGSWKPGQSGNPAGRPKGARAFADLAPKGFDEKLARRIAKLALTGDPDNPLTGQALRIASDRLWPALARTELSGVDGKPIAVEQAEAIAEALPTDALHELDALASKLNAEKGNGAAKPNGSGNGIAH